MAKIFWVTAPSRDENCFIVARTARSAEKLNEDHVGFDRGDCLAEEIINLDKNTFANLQNIRGNSPQKLPFFLHDDELIYLGFRKTIQNGIDVFRKGKRKFKIYGIEELLPKSLRKKDNLLIKNVSDFTKKLEKMPSDDLIFRGQRKASWLLMSSFHRLCKDKNLNFDQIASLEMYIFSEFQRRSRYLISDSPKNDWEWLILAQHFGLPTRLLDWTENPLIALYFAVEKDDREEDDAVVFTINIPKTSYASLSSINPFDNKKIIAIRPPYFDQRMFVQHSILTVEPPSVQNLYERGDISENDDPALAAEVVATWFIPAKYRPSIKRELNRIGFNANRIFPGLGNLTSQLASEAHAMIMTLSKG